MKKTPEQHAHRFSQKAPDYDGSKSPVYEACASHTIRHAGPAAGEVILDIGAGTGAIGLALAADTDADSVVLRDISDGMLEEARAKVRDRELDHVEIGTGSFRQPDYKGPADVVVSNFALHHLPDTEKRAAIATMAEYGPQRIVLGDIMFFGDPAPEAPFYSPEVDDPATVGTLVDAFTTEGYAVIATEAVTDQAGVLVAAPVAELTANRARDHVPTDR
jgi:Methylase involved in ubiquinone/menaquinone biosynthesis